ncbi:hypothetical protein NM208_g12942 [Fusarium decemcellulare]|uniref:Uncharacterized protein n=1 Tax=Fusarium decemcellulare TaxID=57161 RepID=A0ACC1RLP0_9HYPO|nr:hypothetical protein NM208_g12942 [Fusarium decemcellulare]
MKTAITFSSIFAFISLSLSPVSAECFGSGDVWQDKGIAREHVVRACKGFDGQQGAFQGTFDGSSTKSACVQHSPTQKLLFSVSRLASGPADLNDDECVLRLQNEINGCDRGGSSVIGDFSYTADPENGIC